MDDRDIIALYRERSEEAISETKKKYGRYLRSVAKRILGSDSDAEECENDVYLKAWNSIPPDEPDPLRTYLGTLCRRTAFDLYEKRSAGKRGGGQANAVYEELEEMLSSECDGDPAESAALKDAMQRFLSQLGETERLIFLKRYWYFCPVKEIAREMKMKQSAVKMSLLRTRGKLKTFLTEEGFTL